MSDDLQTRISQTATRLGFDSFRPAQRRCIETLMEGRDVLGVIPTGGGKSAIYQTAAELIDGVTVVVSPLLALQQDQLASIEAAGLSAARAIDGSTSASEREGILAELRSGDLEYLFATPEILAQGDLLDALAESAVSLFVVDEAHCIVTWGHGFRPDFLLLADARRRIGSPVTVALTASADPRLRLDICRSLELDDAEIVTHDLVRTNISLAVTTAPTKDVAVGHLVEHLADDDRKSLVYVATRRLTESVAASLCDAGRDAVAYHGGLSKSDRSSVVERVRSKAGCVVVATTAFGMGIDIPDIALVAHLDMPESLLAYYQEVGRAGRDGGSAEGCVFVSLRTRSRRAFAAGVGATSVADCAAVHRALSDGARSRSALIGAVPFGAGRVSRALAVLEQAGAVTIRPRLRVVGSPDPDDLERRCREREEFDRSQIRAVEEYRSGRRCRWSQILTSLGEPLERCGHCDVCDRTDADPKTVDRGDAALSVGDVVEHNDFGRGVVTSIESGVVSVAFERVGPKTLGLDVCVDLGLLAPM